MERDDWGKKSFKTQIVEMTERGPQWTEERQCVCSRCGAPFTEYPSWQYHKVALCKKCVEVIERLAKDLKIVGIYAAVPLGDTYEIPHELRSWK